MRSLRRALLLWALGAAMACTPEPFRTSEPDPAAPPDGRLDIQLVDRLGGGWSIHYLQVYANGWLIWQGVPRRGGGWIARGLPIHSGERELSIRVKVSPGDPARGHLARERERFALRPSAQTLRIILDESVFFPEDLDVELVTQ